MARLKMLSWNVNGLRAAHKKGFLDWLEKESPDIMCLQETKALKEQLPTELLEVDGYRAYFSSAERKGYSGVAIYTKDAPKEIKTGLGIKRFDIEGRTIIAEYEKFTLFNIYYPNGKASPERLKYKMDYYDAFLKYADKLNRQGGKLIICGDVNTAHKSIDLRNPKANEKNSGFLLIERAWIDKLVDHGYVDTFRMFHPDEPDHYTWWTYRMGARARNVGWRIDYFFITEEHKGLVKDAFILKDVMGSDHCPLGVELNV